MSSHDTRSTLVVMQEQKQTLLMRNEACVSKANAIRNPPAAEPKQVLPSACVMFEFLKQYYSVLALGESDG